MITMESGQIWRLNKNVYGHHYILLCYGYDTSPKLWECQEFSAVLLKPLNNASIYEYETIVNNYIFDCEITKKWHNLLNVREIIE